MQSNSKISQNDIDRAIAIVIGSTRRVKRKRDLLEIAENIKLLQDALGGLKQVSAVTSLSKEMLRQFLRVEDLVPSVQAIIRNNEIVSVDLADRISRLPKADQVTTANAARKGELTSKDLRDLVAFRKRYPEVSLKEAINRIKSDQLIKEYVLEFPFHGNSESLNSIERRIASIVGTDNIRSFELRKANVEVVLTSEGKKRFENEARNKRISKNHLLKMIVYGG